MRSITPRSTWKRSPPRVLMVDVGGGSVKLRVSGQRAARSFATGKDLSAQELAATVRRRTAGWMFDVVSIGYPGPIRDGRPSGEPPRVGTGWTGFDYDRAFERPVRMINDASLQALAAYRGPRLLYLGLGTGLGSTLIADGILIPLELGWLRFNTRHSLLQRLADWRPDRVRADRWRRDVVATASALEEAFEADELVLGGGNAARLGRLPRHWRRRTNAQAMLGAIRLWGDLDGVLATPRGALWEVTI